MDFRWPRSLYDRAAEVTIGTLSGAVDGEVLVDAGPGIILISNVLFCLLYCLLIRPYALIFGPEISYHKWKGMIFSRVLCSLDYIWSSTPSSGHHT